MLNSTSIIGAQEVILIFMQSGPFAQSLEEIFVANGYQVSLVSTETAAYLAVKESAPSLIIIERQDGIAVVLRHLRTTVTVPIVAVVNGSGQCGDEEQLQDYDRDIDLVLCNRTPREVVARVQAILRRCVPTSQLQRYFYTSNVQMDLDRHEVTVDGRKVELTLKEFQVLRQLMEAPGRVFTRQEVHDRVWGKGFAVETHALDVHIHSLRQKIERDPASPKVIVTVHGIGYKICE